MNLVMINSTMTMKEFIDLVRDFNGVTAFHDFENDEIAENYINTTCIILRKYISLDEIEDIKTE